MKKELKIGDFVKVHDWSYTLDDECKPDNHMDYLTFNPNTPENMKKFEIIEFGEFDADNFINKFIKLTIEINDTVIKNTITGKKFAIQKRFLTTY